MLYLRLGTLNTFHWEATVHSLTSLHLWMDVVRDKVWLITKNGLTERLQYRDTCSHDGELNHNKES